MLPELRRVFPFIGRRKYIENKFSIIGLDGTRPWFGRRTMVGRRPSSGLGKKGVYTILISVDPLAQVEVGKIGRFDFSGLYAYTGSAIGKGSSSLEGRVARHLSKIKKLRWHIDYLLSHPNARVSGIVTSSTTKKSNECRVSRSLLGSAGSVSIVGFGSSDCGCRTHLVRLETTLENAFQAISSTHRAAGLKPITATKRNFNRILLLRKYER